MSLRIEVHLLSHDGEADNMLEWSVRHYLAVADRIVIHDGGPTGLSTKWVETGKYHAPDSPFLNVECRPWDTAAELNDALAMRLKNTCWRGTDADFVITADMDELVYSPLGLRRRLAIAKEQGAAVLRPHGFEMFSDHWFEAHTYVPEVQLTELAPFGAPDDDWYAKPIVFSPRLVEDSGFGLGAHESRPWMKDGRGLVCDRKWPFASDLHLLHYKSIFGGIDRIARRYDETRKRLCAQNVRNNWGNVHDSGAVHAQKKRDRLLPHVRRIIP